jgi:putative sigma-54 modulation protein
MQLKISFIHMDHSDAVESHIKEKATRLKKYLNGKIDVEWTCEASKHEHISHVNVHGKGFHYHANASADNLYKTIDMALEKVERQIVRKKEKVTNKHHIKLAGAIAAPF